MAELVFRVALPDWIPDSAEAEMRSAQARLGQPEIVEVRFDCHAEIDRRQPLERRQAMERHLRVLFPVDRDDVLAAPAQELIDAEVLDVSAVRQVDPRAL